MKWWYQDYCDWNNHLLSMASGANLCHSCEFCIEFNNSSIKLLIKFSIHRCKHSQPTRVGIPMKYKVFSVTIKNRTFYKITCGQEACHFGTLLVILHFGDNCIHQIALIHWSEQSNGDVARWYLCMPWKSVHKSLILSAHISGVIWYWSITRCGSRSSVANISGWQGASS